MTTSRLTPDTGPVEGLCGPGAPDDEISRLDVEITAGRLDALSRLGDGTVQMHPELVRAAEHLRSTGASERLRLLSHPAAQLALWSPTPSTHVVDDPPFDPGPEAVASWLGALWTEGLVPATSSFTVIPGRARDAALLLPDAAIVIRTGGPVAVEHEPDGIRMTLPGSGRLALSGSLTSLPPGSHAGGRVQVLPRAAGRPVLNEWPMVGRICAVHRAAPEEVRQGLPHLEDALDLLGEVWPGMRGLVDRWVRGFVVIAYEGCSRSHTSIYSPHVPMISVESPVSIAEALCHETSHGRLFVFAARHELLVDDHVPRWPSPWRPDRRPLISFLNGVHAFVAVCEFYRRLADHDSRFATVAERALTRQVPRLLAGWRFLEERAVWAADGEWVAATLRAAVRAWAT